MTLSRRTTLGIAALLALSGVAAADPQSKGLPVQAVYELFTSQGCSSCPPADLLFHALRDEPGVLTLSMPVTIWDHLGWKDTLAQTGFSKRQKGYSHARGDRQIYTPQAVINGVSHCVGSDRKAIEAARRESAQQPGVLALRPVLLRSASGWSVKLPAQTSGTTIQAGAVGEAGARDGAPALGGTVLLVTYSRDLTVDVGKGENGGRAIRYANVVRSISKIGEYAGVEVTFDLPQGLRADAAEGFAVLVQTGTPKHPAAILAAVESPRE